MKSFFKDNFQDQRSDKELVKSAAQDMTAFETLYQRHYRKVYSLCLRMLQNTYEAEDLTQEVFIQVYRKGHTFQGKSAFTTWLHTVTTNQVKMYFRSKIVKKETTEKTDDWIKFILDKKIQYNMPAVEKMILDKAIDQLPEGYKRVFVLHDIEGYEHEEIAKILGCSPGTSKSQLHKARQKMKKLISKIANPRLVPSTAW